MKINKDSKKIDELLTRGVAEVIDLKNLKERLLSASKPLRIKLGIDPTSPNLHLGRAVAILKLKDFQDLGHKIVFIIGDFTGQIGDTSDKESERPMLSKEQVKKNMKEYVKQLHLLLDTTDIEIQYNSKWLAGLNFSEIGALADQFSVAEFNARENIKKRLDEGKRVSLREVLYPLMQGYDSVEIKADVEIGGTDQRFNMLAGRTLQKYYKQEPQDIVMTNIVAGLDGRKMSSSWGNTINFHDTPSDMFGKVMSMPDNLILTYFIHCTRVPMDEVNRIEADLKNGKNPRDAKIRLAWEIVKIYYAEDEAKKAQDNFIKTFSKKETPDEMPELKPSAMDILTVLVEAKICASKSEARRVVEQGGAKINDQKVTSIDAQVKPGDIVQKGSRFFVKIK